MNWLQENAWILWCYDFRASNFLSSELHGFFLYSARNHQNHLWFHIWKLQPKQNGHIVFINFVSLIFYRWRRRCICDKDNLDSWMCAYAYACVFVLCERRSVCIYVCAWMFFLSLYIYFFCLVWLCRLCRSCYVRCVVFHFHHQINCDRHHSVVVNKNRKFY